MADLKPTLLFLCNWQKDKPSTWSGTPYSLLQQLKRHFDIIDVNVSLNILEKIWCKVFSYKIENKKLIKTGWVLNEKINRLFEKKAKKALKKYKTDFVLEIGDFYAEPQRRIYTYQDFNVLYLKEIYETDPKLFSLTGYSGTHKDIEKREIRAKKFYHNATGIFFMGNWILDYTKKFYPNKCFYVGAGANVFPSKPKLHINKNILFIGRDFIRKGGDLVVEAFRILYQQDHQVRLLIAGPSSLEQKYLPEGVTYLGDMKPRELEEVYSKCSLFVMPSRFEAFGLVFVEALLHGLPVIASDRYEMKHIIRDGETGYLLKNEDAEELAAKMREALENKAMHQRVMDAYEELVKNFTWEAVAAKMASVMLNDKEKEKNHE